MFSQGQHGSDNNYRSLYLPWDCTEQVCICFALFGKDFLYLQTHKGINNQSYSIAHSSNHARIRPEPPLSPDHHLLREHLGQGHFLSFPSALQCELGQTHKWKVPPLVVGRDASIQLKFLERKEQESKSSGKTTSKNNLSVATSLRNG